MYWTGRTPQEEGALDLVPDCRVHYLWFAFVCFLIRSPPPWTFKKKKPRPKTDVTRR